MARELEKWSDEEKSFASYEKFALSLFLPLLSDF